MVDLSAKRSYVLVRCGGCLMSDRIALGKLELIPHRQLLADGQPITIGRKAIEILSALVKADGKVMTKAELMDAVWPGTVIEENALQAQMTALRKAMGGESKLIKTIHGLGYLLKIPTVGEHENSLPPIPTIAVMPFADLIGDPEQSYFVDGLMEELTSALTRIRTLFVISSGSSLTLRDQGLSPNEAAEKLGVRYILQGSVRAVSNDVRINVTLIDTDTGGQIWANSFNGSMEDVFSLQEQVAIGVAGVTEFSIQKSETQRVINRPTSDLQSYHLYLRALVPFRTYTRQNIEKAMALLGEAIERDEEHALALSLAGTGHGLIAQFGWTDDPESQLAKMKDLFERALYFGSDDAQVVATAALSYWTVGRYVEASRHADRAVELNPGSSFAHIARGQLSAHAGRLAAAEDSIIRSMELDPFSPNRALQLGSLAQTRFVQERYIEAARLTREWTQINKSPMNVALLAACLNNMGESQAAEDAISEMNALSPITLPNIAAMFFLGEDLRQKFLDAVTLSS